MADINDSDKPAEPTPTPNTGASVPNDQPLSQAPLIDGIQQAASDAISGKNAAAIGDMYAKAAHGDPTAQAMAAQQSLGMAMMGSLHTNVPGAGLAQQAEQAVGKEAATGFSEKLASLKQLAEDAYAALQRGEITPAQAEGARQKYMAAMDQAARHSKQVKGYADGGEVGPQDPGAAFDSMTAEAPLPATAADMVSQSSPEPSPLATPSFPDAAPSAATNVVNPEGKLVSIPTDQLQDALAAGYTHATPEHIAEHIKQEKYGSVGQQALTGLEGAASAGTFGLSTGAEEALGVPAEDIQGRRDVNPGVHALGQLGGLGVSALTGVGEAAALGRLGEGAAAMAGLSAPTTVLAKIGSAAVKAAIENAAFTGGDEVSKMIAGDPHQSVETAVTDMGISALLGGGIGGTIGAVPALWHAAMGAKTEGVLGAIKNRLGGFDGDGGAGSPAGGTSVPMDSAVNDALVATGLDQTLAPEVRASLSSDPRIKAMASTLEQSDTTGSGRAFQEAMGDARTQAAEVQASALGSTLEDIPAKGDIDKYTTGKTIADTLAKEYGDRVAPLAQAYEEHAAKFAGAELAPSVADKALEAEEVVDKAFGKLTKAQKELQKALKAQDPGRAIEAEAAVTETQQALRMTKMAVTAPGTVDGLQERIANLVTREGWGASPSSEIMTEIRRIQKELPNLKTLSDLSNYIKAVGDNTKSTHPFGLATPVSRAGGLIKSILRDAEGELIEMHLGQREGAEALTAYRQTQAAYRQAAILKEAVDDRLGAGGSVGGFAKTVRAMGAQEGEKVLRRLSGAGDADLLALLQKEFPETAKAVKQHHIDSLLAAAKDGDSLSSKKLMSAMDKMSPQLRDFAIDQNAQGKIKAVNGILEQLNDKTHNFSNTARTIDKLTQHSGGAALGLVSMLTGHGAANGFIAGQFAHLLGKTVPDAGRLALLKFLGSTAPIDGGALKVAADLIGRTAKGEALVSKAAKNVFKDGAEVIPESKMPTEAMREKLDKKLQSIQNDPTQMLDVGGKIGHYMPEHASAMGEVSARVSSYVNANRPVSQQMGALDKPMPPTDAAKDKFARILDIAQQPLIVLDRIKSGTILPEDVVALKSLYPKMYDNLVSKLTAAMTEHMSSGEEVPYHTRVGLSMFMGQPLDSTMTPEAIQAAQPKPQAPAPQQRGQAPKHSTAKLGKLANQFMTPDQAREADKLKK